MATAEELWGARSKDAAAFADKLLDRRKASSKPVRAKKTESVDTGSLSGAGSTFQELEDENKKEWFETPIVKGIIDAISIGTYTGAANANQAVQGVRAAKEKIEGGGNALDAVGEYIGTGLDQLVNHNPAVMGVKAAFGDKDSKRLGHDTVKDIQSITQGEEYSDSAEAKGIQGGVGLAMDIVGDPTWAIPGIVPAKTIGGAFKGAAIGAKAAKDIAKGGEALDRTVGRFAGMKAGAKKGAAEAKAEKAEKLKFRIAQRDINYRGADPKTLRENIRGFDFLPEDVIAGQARLTGKAARVAARTDSSVRKTVEKDVVTEVQKLADSEEFVHVQSPEEIAKSVVNAHSDYALGKISIGKHDAIVRTMRGTAKTFGHNFDEIVEEYTTRTGLRAPKAAEETIAKGVPAAAKAEESAEKAAIPMPAGEASVGKIGEEIGQAAKATELKARLENPESITPAYSYVDNPGTVNPMEYVRDRPVDEFVKGTAHLSTEVPRLGKKTQKEIQDFLKAHPGASKTVAKEEVLNSRAIQQFVVSKKLRESRVNPDKVLNEFRTRFPDGTVRGAMSNLNRSQLSDLIDKTLAKKVNADAIRKLHAHGDADGANLLRDTIVTKVLKEKIYAEDLMKLTNSVADAIVTPEVVHFAWAGTKPTPAELKKLGFKGDVREAMKTIREFGGNLEQLSRKSGAFRDILEAYRLGKLPVDDMARFEEFASTFFKLEGENRLNKAKILEMASDFVRENSDSLMASSLLHAPLADAGRLTALAGGGAGEAKGVLRILPPDRIQTYSRPFREDERIAIVEGMATKAEADILNGISPDFVGKLADDLIDKHFVEYSTPAGDLMTRGYWRTSTSNLTDGLPKKEYFWTTHSAIDLFTKLNTDVTAYMKNIPELAEIRTLAKSSKSTAAQRKNYEAAYRNVKDNLSMRALAHVDVQLKAHNIFGYLTNTMPAGDTAIRLSLYDVLNAMGPEIRKKHLWVPKNDINGIIPTQFMDLSETLLRTLKGADSTGEADLKLMLKNSKEILAGNFTKNTNAANIARMIEQNLDDVVKGREAGMLAANRKEYPRAEMVRKGRITSLINDVMNKVGDDGLTPLQKLADTTLRNTAMHSSHFSKQIVFATEQQMKRLKESLEFGTVGNFSEVVSSVTRPDRFEPEVSKVFTGEVRGANLQHVSPDELAVATEVANVARISTGKEMVLWTSKEMEPWTKKTPTEAISAERYTLPIGPKPRIPANKMKLSTANASEVMLNGMRILTDGKVAATKWTIKPWTTNAGKALRDEINTANAKVAGRVQNTKLHPDSIAETVAAHSDEEIVNFMRIEQAHDEARRLFVGQQMFNVRFGKEISYDAVTSGMHLGTALETAFHGMLNEYSRKYTLEQAKKAMADIQSVNANIHELVARGAIAGLDPAVVDLAKMTGHVFDSSTNNFFVRNGVGPTLMNNILNDMGHIPKSWRFPTLVDGEIITPAQMGQVWKTWEIDHPYKAMAAIHTAMVKASSDISMGARFSNRFGMQKPPVGEADQWAKIGNFGESKSAFVGLIDANLYYPKEIIAELPEWGNFITASRTFKNEKFQQWVNSFDELTSALKLTQTVMKPGHHVMSVMGDFFRNRLAGVVGTGHIKDSWRIIRSRNVADRGLSEMDKYARIKDGSLEMSIQTKTSGKGTRIMVGGRQVIIDDSQMYDMMVQRGIFLPPHNAGVAEDLLAGSGSNKFINMPGGKVANTVSAIAAKTNSGISSLVNNKVIKLNSFTSQRDNLFRGELAVHAMKSKNFKSVEEALDHAEKILRKWSPTAKDLTAMESKYNRRVFLYYTWIRGMIPRVVESLVAKPQIATMPSKAMYNMAIANGLNPNSIGDPFDPNELMPHYYTNGILGPQWKDPNTGHLWGGNPTAPVIDVFNSVGAGTSLSGMVPFSENNNFERVGRLLMGMTNPIMRSPVEMAIGRNVGTDSPIMDNGQYLTDMPGPLRYASKVTGHTINPMLGGLPRRTEAKYKDGMDSDEWWQNAALETFNYNTGVQVKDYTSDSAVKSAEFDEKDKLKQEKTNETRMNWWGQ